jgi:S-adenosylmethionine/arginine decarboxylase-like enzyme
MTNGRAFVPSAPMGRGRRRHRCLRQTRLVEQSQLLAQRYRADSPPVHRRRHVARELAANSTLEKSHHSLTAEFSGVPAEQLRDATLLGGLLIAAASAVGFSTIGVPTVRTQSDTGISAVLLLDGAHIAIHSIPERQTLLFDGVAPASHDFRKAVEVFSRRLTARDVRSETRGRG